MGHVFRHLFIAGAEITVRQAGSLPKQIPHASMRVYTERTSGLMRHKALPYCWPATVLHSLISRWDPTPTNIPLQLLLRRKEQGRCSSTSHRRCGKRQSKRVKLLVKRFRCGDRMTTWFYGSAHLLALLSTNMLVRKWRQKTNK